MKRDQGCVQPQQNFAKRLLNRNGGVLNTVLMTQVLQLWQLRRSFFVFFLKIFSEPTEIGINMCLILQNTLDVTRPGLRIQRPLGTMPPPHTHTHTHTHVGFCGLWGLSIGVMVFILYKLYVLLPYTNPTPKLSPRRRLCASLDFQKNTI